jgi:hypothetical protein
VRRATEKFGLKFKQSRDLSRSVRSTVSEMKVADAVEFLTCLVEELVGNPEDEWGIFPDISLTPAERRLFSALHAREGTLLTHDQALTAVLIDAANPPDAGIVKVYISRMRIKLCGKVKIRVLWGEGYIMSREPGVIFPWEVDDE